MRPWGVPGSLPGTGTIVALSAQGTAQPENRHPCPHVRRPVPHRQLPVQESHQPQLTRPRGTRQRGAAAALRPIRIPDGVLMEATLQ